MGPGKFILVFVILGVFRVCGAEVIDYIEESGVTKSINVYTFDDNNELISSTIAIPDNLEEQQTYSLYPDTSEYLPNQYRYVCSTLLSKKCQLTITPDWQTIGIHKFTMNSLITDDTEEKTQKEVTEEIEFALIIRDKVDTNLKSITTIKSKDVYFQLTKEMQRLQNGRCTITNPAKETIDLLPSTTTGSLRYWNNNNENLCGVHISNIDLSGSGEWILEASNSSYYFYSAIVKITVIEEPQIKEISLDHKLIETKTNGQGTIAIENDSNGKLIICSIIQNHKNGQEEKFELYPNLSEKLPEEIQFTGRPDDYLLEWCKINIKPNVKTNGEFILTSEVSVEKSGEERYLLNTKQPFTAVVQDAVDGIIKELVVVEGQDVYLRFKDPVDEYLNILLCDVKKPNGLILPLMKDEPVGDVPTVEYWNNDNDNKCGVYIKKIDSLSSGTWTLRAATSDNHYLSASFKITVESELSSTIPETVEVTVGEESTLSFRLTDNRETTWCRHEHPNGDLSEIQSKQCTVKLNPVTSNDLGTWKAIYGVLGAAEVIETSTKVKSKDPSFTSSITNSSNQWNLLCGINSPYIRHCYFERPDGVIINMNQGIGHERYSYFGAGYVSYNTIGYYPEKQINDCGISIKNLEREDQGYWKCVVHEEEKNPVRAAFLHVGDEKTKTELPIISEAEVDVVQDEPLTISCSTRSSLLNCWARNPNGTVFNPQPNRKYEGYEYTGTGFEFGECKITLFKASKMDIGKWECHMGVVGQKDLVSRIEVNVYDTHLIPDPDIKIGDDKTYKIACRTVNSQSIDYCRFVRPDGEVFNVASPYDEVSKSYRNHINLKEGKCSLTIFHRNEDIGRWECAAYIQSINEEIIVSQNIKENIFITEWHASSVVGLCIGLTALVIILAVVVGYKACSKAKRQRAQRYSQNSIPGPMEPIPSFLERGTSKA